jgi:hypothetical protein
MVRLSSILLLVLLLTYCGTAQWSTDPSNNLIVGYGLNPELASDSAGGCYITYEQNTTYPRRLILERLDRYGYKPWGGGKRILGLLPEQSFAKITEDGCTGVIISYLDIEVTGDPHNQIITSRLRVQRVDSSGNLLWDSVGVRVTLSNTDQTNQAIVSDGSGGCIVAWVDTLGDLRINRIDSLGTRVWGDSGKYVWNSPERPPLISDGQGGCYIVYGIGRLQRFDRDGNMYWPSSGILVPMGAAQMQIDSQSNVYLFGSIFIGINDGIYTWTKNIQKVSYTGQRLWDSVGIVVDTEKTNNPSTNYSMFVTPQGFACLAWGNHSNDTTINYIQNISGEGNIVFEKRSNIGSSNSKKNAICVIGSDNTAVIYSWMDYRNSSWGLYAQKADTAGKTYWDTNDVAITLNGFSDFNTVSDGAGGVIAMWEVTASFAILAQQVSKNGLLGEVITVVDDREYKQLPENFALYQNFPNPFNSNSVIRYNLPNNEQVILEVFDLLGQKVKALVDQYQTAGTYSVTFEAGSLPSGIYFFRLKTEKAILTKKLTILK